jgi:hypothetical protein
MRAALIPSSGLGLDAGFGFLLLRCCWPCCLLADVPLACDGWPLPPADADSVAEGPAPTGFDEVVPPPRSLWPLFDVSLLPPGWPGEVEGVWVGEGSATGAPHSVAG